jgi:squalene synthase HpnC
MADPAFTDELATLGPAGHGPRMTLEQAEAWCRLLARRHYENFTVASWLLPRHLRQPFANVYAFCRWSDDLADETEGGVQALDLLDWWEDELQSAFCGRARHPVYVALSRTIADYELEIGPFLDLLSAFRQDQSVARYAGWPELLDYCRRSANPVGRIVLRLGRCATPDHFPLADSICTGLQLANFCQDVAQDWDRGRIYLPASEMSRAELREEDFDREECSRAFRQVLAAVAAQAEERLMTGLPLAAMVPRGLGLDVELFARGGLEIIRLIRGVDYDVWRHRPRLSKLRKLRLFLSAWRRQRAGRRVAPR